MKTRTLSLFLLLFAAACAQKNTPVQWQYRGGDAKKGIVYLSYDHAEFQNARAGQASPQLMADKRCRQLGFQKAARVQGSRSECVRKGGMIGTCSVTRTTYEYLCGEYPAPVKKETAKKTGKQKSKKK
ncbi:YecR family lipoprotein [Neisseria wadsworthii]|uniref:Lipoprotein n=1 Tax=Neisseria wadsworthii 9715 TaxID=1030841 RepID=G4CM96_9NEIS|nr:YecR family lipoprotein [Neisseria wadsworthii]EGZ51176.1 hypothetical protein HMPREF9370_0205 [Neisseria wadsworthii 9715]QMT36257.1 hypothetical protein H3L96_03205 [Neisseria wadsworthii]